MKSTYGRSPASTFSAIVKPHATSVLATTSWRTSTASISTTATTSQTSACSSSAERGRVSLRNAGSPTIELMSRHAMLKRCTPLPHGDHRFAERSHQQPIAEARHRNHVLVPDLDLPVRRHARAEDEPIGQGGDHADAVDVAKA